MRQNAPFIAGLLLLGTLFSETLIPPQRLSEGRSLSFSSDTTKVLWPAEKGLGAISFCFLKGWANGHSPYNKSGEYTLTPKLESAIRELRLPWTRFHEITWGLGAMSMQDALDRVAALLDKLAIPQESSVINLNVHDARTREKPMKTPEEWAGLVRYSISKGYRFRFW
ncbi:MAG: hypothetical protein JNM63_19240, partial [Spirochaetia bacterium]|nr:hypothetical protein [Spirochaetia bacterium]